MRRDQSSSSKAEDVQDEENKVRSSSLAAVTMFESFLATSVGSICGMSVVYGSGMGCTYLEYCLCDTLKVVQTDSGNTKLDIGFVLG